MRAAWQQQGFTTCIDRWATRGSDLLLEHANTFGGDTAFQEDTFANKKLMPGHAPRTGSRKWNNRLQVTESGFCTMIRFITAAHGRKPAQIRRKYDKVAVEEALAMSQLTVSLIDEVCEAYPIDKEFMTKKVITELFISGDMNLELELQAALQEKSEEHKPSDISAVNELVKAFVATKREHMESMVLDAPTVTAGQLERQELDLLLKSIQFDIDAYKVWFTRSVDRESAVYYRSLQHRGNRINKARNIAKQLLSQGNANYRASFEELKDTTKTYKVIEAQISTIARMNQLANPTDVV